MPENLQAGDKAAKANDDAEELETIASELTDLAERAAAVTES